MPQTGVGRRRKDGAVISLQVIPLDCSGCGRCCETQSYPPFHDYEQPFIPADLRAEIDASIDADIAAGFIEEKPCLWFDLATRQCKHYDDRPDVCHDFVVGSDGCLCWRNELISPCGRDSCVER